MTGPIPRPRTRGAITLTRDIIVRNLLWFGGSLALAFFVWVVAVVQADPVTQRSLNERVPVTLTQDPALVIVNASEISSTAAVTVRGPETVIGVMTPEDITLTADLTGLGPGEHAVPVEWMIAPENRASVVSLTPRTLTVRLENRLDQLKAVRVDITALPAAVYAVGAPESDLLQAEVSGPESRVTQIAQLLARVDLEAQRTNYSTAVPLVAVDAQGRTITGVSINPPTAEVSVAIEPRSDVVEVRVQPNIVGSLPEGYVLTPDFAYTPQSIVVRGTQDVLESLPGTLYTEPIDLSDRTSSFEVTVPVELPNPRLLVVTGRTITVNVGIDAQQVTRRFDRIPLALLGALPDLTYTLSPREVTLLVTGPQPTLDLLDARDLTATVDVGALSANAGTVQVAPLPSIGQADGELSVSVLPAQIDVTVLPDATPEPTP